ncbi:2'-5'-oligoadenylate synthase-like protein 2 [Phascolarctos cinereus]|uniref:2'-5'-oligoadenylate synthase-like protein 2 n=1 Tax=Phascolarctos cinereus TaxID=38626 RepID=A0A6P5LYQ0_PHACI|nr:2'-5'-oligoadenylate synthase-like protein 2 [Phascolarctos cinereus]
METFTDLYDTPAEKLDAFVAHALQPDKEWKDEVKDVFERIAGFFQEQCFQDYIIRDKPVKVMKVVKGGSFSKGVELKHTSDVDMLLFLSCFSSYEDHHKLRGPVIEFMREKLEKCQESIAYAIINISEQKSSNRSVPPRSLNFDVHSKKRKKPIHVDVLPVFDALGEENPPSREENYSDLDSRLTVQQKVYEKLIKNRGGPGEFTPSFSELQRSFVKHRPAKLKSLLQLVKHWYREYVKNKYPGKHYPPKYALELLTIYAWETGTEKAEDFSLAEGFVTVMKLLRDYKNICIYWTDYYNFKNQVVGRFVKRQLKQIPPTEKKKGPVILDPADPTNKVGYQCRWHEVAKEASYCLSQACSQMKDGRYISSWNIKEARNIWVTLKCPGLWKLNYYVNPYDPIQEMKKEIERVKNIPISDQRLSFKEPRIKPKVLMGHSTLANYGIFYQIQIQVLDISSARCKIHVKFPNDTYQTYPFEKKDTVLMVKQQIEEQERLPIMGQHLSFQGQRLRGRKSLRVYGIEDGDTLELELTRR